MNSENETQGKYKKEKKPKIDQSTETNQKKIDNKDRKNSDNVIIDSKEEQPQSCKIKVNSNQTKRNNQQGKKYNQHEQLKENIPSKQLSDTIYSHQQQLLLVKEPKQRGNQVLGSSMQLSQLNDLKMRDDLIQISSAQTTKTALRESSFSGENRYNLYQNNHQKTRIKSCQQTIHQNQQEFSFCYDKNNTPHKDENNLVVADGRNILGQIQNIISLETQNKDQHYPNGQLNTFKKWNQFGSLSQTTKNNNQFNLKCKQQQNVVKKIFNFDTYQTSQTTTTTACSEVSRSRRQSTNAQGSNSNYNTQQLLDQQQLLLQKQLMYYGENRNY